MRLFLLVWSYVIVAALLALLSLCDLIQSLLQVRFLLLVIRGEGVLFFSLCSLSRYSLLFALLALVCSLALVLLLSYYLCSLTALFWSNRVCIFLRSRAHSCSETFTCLLSCSCSRFFACVWLLLFYTCACLLALHYLWLSLLSLILASYCSSFIARICLILCALFCVTVYQPTASY